MYNYTNNRHTPNLPRGKKTFGTHSFTFVKLRSKLNLRPTLSHTRKNNQLEERILVLEKTNRELYEQNTDKSTKIDTLTTDCMQLKTRMSLLFEKLSQLEYTLSPNLVLKRKKTRLTSITDVQTDPEHEPTCCAEDRHEHQSWSTILTSELHSTA